MEVSFSAAVDAEHEVCCQLRPLEMYPFSGMTHWLREKLCHAVYDKIRIAFDLFCHQ